MLFVLSQCPSTITCICVGELGIEVLIWWLWRWKLLLQTEGRHQLLEKDTRPVTVPAETAHNAICWATCKHRDTDRRVLPTNIRISQQCGLYFCNCVPIGECVQIHLPTTLKYWSNSPTLTDRRSDSLMDRQHNRQTSGSPESKTSNTDPQTKCSRRY